MTNYWQKRREELGKSQRQIAHEIGVSNTTVSMWERDELVPHLQHLAALMKAYDASEAEIVREIVATSKRMQLTAAE